MIIATRRLCDEPEGIYEDAAVIFPSITIGAYFVESITSHMLTIHSNPCEIIFFAHINITKGRVLYYLHKQRRCAAFPYAPLTRLHVSPYMRNIANSIHGRIGGFHRGGGGGVTSTHIPDQRETLLVVNINILLVCHINIQWFTIANHLYNLHAYKGKLYRTWFHPFIIYTLHNVSV